MNPFEWLGRYIYDPFFYHPFINLLVALMKGFEFLHIPGAFGFAVIILTILIRLALHPFFHQQMHTAKKMQDIKPHLDKLSQKHKKDPKRLQEEQMRLYREAGINPASGCLFLIVQMPVFIALYQTLNLFLSNSNAPKIITQINKILYFPSLKIASIDPMLLGINLALSPAKAGQWYYYLIPVATGFLQYLQVAVSIPPARKEEESKKTKEQKKEEKTGTGEDFQKAMQTQMKYIFPIMIGWFSYTLPIGLSLYWNIFSLFSIIQYKIAHSKNTS